MIQNKRKTWFDEKLMRKFKQKSFVYEFYGKLCKAETKKNCFVRTLLEKERAHVGCAQAATILCSL